MPDDGFSRRAFLRGVSASAIGAAALSGAAGGAAEAQEKPLDGAVAAIGPGPAPLELVLNGKKRSAKVEPRATLLDALRFHLGTTGPKEVCDRGACGACTVLLDGAPVVACMVLAHDAHGRSVETVEGLGTPEAPHPVQAAFVACDALQCGFCTPGMVMSVKALLDREKDPSAEAIKEAVAGNVCRCGTYPRVFEAAARAARAARGGAGK